MAIKAHDVKDTRGSGSRMVEAVGDGVRIPMNTPHTPAPVTPVSSLATGCQPAAERDLLTSCVHCGLCLEVCLPGNLLKSANGFTSESLAGIDHAERIFNTPPKYEEGGTIFRFSRERVNEEETDSMLEWFARCAADVNGIIITGKSPR